MLARDPLPIHTIPSALFATQHNLLPPRFDRITLSHIRAILVRRPATLKPFLRILGHPAKSVTLDAFALALELGPPCGVALAALLPGILARAESEPPQHARDLRQLDATLCAMIALVEQLAPERIEHLCEITQRDSTHPAPWWTVRARYRLREALWKQRVQLQ